jgi:hypothetical protein
VYGVEDAAAIEVGSPAIAIIHTLIVIIGALIVIIGLLRAIISTTKDVYGVDDAAVISGLHARSDCGSSGLPCAPWRCQCYVGFVAQIKYSHPEKCIEKTQNGVRFSKIFV